MVSVPWDRLPPAVAAVRTEDWRFAAPPISHVRLGPEYGREAARFLTVLAVIPGIFLLAACSNMVLLLLTRGAEQTHELVVRRALGASRRDLIRPLAAELAVLVVAGGLAALVALRWVGPVLSALPQLAPLGAVTAAPGAGAALWTLAVAAAGPATGSRRSSRGGRSRSACVANDRLRHGGRRSGEHPSRHRPPRSAGPDPPGSPALGAARGPPCLSAGGRPRLRSRCARFRRRSPCPPSGRRASSSSETRAPRSAARAPASHRSTGTP